MLDEYYHLFYGPAAAEMKAFIEFCETNYARLGSDGEAAGEALRPFRSGESGDGSRIGLRPTHRAGGRISDHAAQPRLADARRLVPQVCPQFRVIDMGKDKWRDARDTLVIDGKLDEPFWTGYSLRGTLKDVRTGKKPKYPTHFRVRWWNDSLYFAIRCEGESGVPPIIGGSRDGDPAIWNGEHLELLIETDKHSYYQIVINPGRLDHGVSTGASPRSNWYDWSAQAEVAAHRGDDFWSVELKLAGHRLRRRSAAPIGGQHAVQVKADALESGKGTSLPWYFNLFRKRAGSDDGETTAFSPLGPDAKTFHDPLKFGEIYVQ